MVDIDSKSSHTSLVKDDDRNKKDIPQDQDTESNSMKKKKPRNKTAGVGVQHTQKKKKQGQMQVQQKSRKQQQQPQLEESSTCSSITVTVEKTKSDNETKEKEKKSTARRRRTRSNKNKSSNNKESLSELPQTNPTQEMIMQTIVDKSMLSSKTFAENPCLSETSKRAISHKLGLTFMTQVQAKTFDAVFLERKDVLARARTGTGKTLAFLLPSVEILLKQNNDTQDEEKHDNSIGMLVISPTRELAIQIGEQAKILCEFNNEMNVQVMYGGTKVERDIHALSSRKGIPKILIATPGRLLDHLQSTRINGHSFSDMLKDIQILVLDETDRLLDMGFRRDIEKIISFLTTQTQQRRQRQTLLFSATIPEEMKPIMKQTMRESPEEFIIVDCINDKDSKTVTNEHIIQSHVIIPSIDQYVTNLIQIVLQAQSEEGSNKIIVFFPTARLVSYFAELFTQILNIPNILEIHSRKSQAHRNKASEQFRSSSSTKKVILFTSDVSARGVDYPDVSHVIQFGIPDSIETYLHRLGRTGRAGKKGKGWLVLQSFEAGFLNELKKTNNIDVPENTSLLCTLQQEENQQDTRSKTLHKSLNLFESHLENMRDENINTEKLEISVSQAYQAFLGYYKGQMKRLSLNNKKKGGASELVMIANEVSKQMGMKEPPFLEKKTIGKMGLKGVEGIRVGSGFNKRNQ